MGNITFATARNRKRPTCRETVSSDSRRMVAPLVVVAVTAAILYGWLPERGRQPVGPEGWARPGTIVAGSVGSERAASSRRAR